MVMVHKKTSTRETWAPYASEAWYLSPTTHHYRCYRVWVWETKAERVSNTLTWLPTNIVMSIPGSDDRAIAAAANLVTALRNPSSATAIVTITGNNLATLDQIATIF